MTDIAVRLDGMRGKEMNSTRYRATDDDGRASLHMRQSDRLNHAAMTRN